MKSDIRLPVLELLPDGSYRSVLIWPRATPKQRQAPTEATRRGEDLVPDRARPVRVVDYEIPDRDDDARHEQHGTNLEFRRAGTSATRITYSDFMNCPVPQRPLNAPPMPL